MAPFWCVLIPVAVESAWVAALARLAELPAAGRAAEDQPIGPVASIRGMLLGLAWLVYRSPLPVVMPVALTRRPTWLRLGMFVAVSLATPLAYAAALTWMAN